MVRRRVAGRDAGEGRGEGNGGLVVVVDERVRDAGRVCGGGGRSCWR